MTTENSTQPKNSNGSEETHRVQFHTPHLTWRQLRDFLNAVTEEEILDLPVTLKEHHHFSFLKATPEITYSFLECMDGQDEDHRQMLLKKYLKPQSKDATDRILDEIEAGPFQESAWTFDHLNQFHLNFEEV